MLTNQELLNYIFNEKYTEFIILEFKNFNKTVTLIPGIGFIRSMNKVRSVFRYFKMCLKQGEIKKKRQR